MPQTAYMYWLGIQAKFPAYLFSKTQEKLFSNIQLFSNYTGNM